jgi:tyrosinase
MWELATDDGPRVAHRSPSFLPWHRKFLVDFEVALQEIDPTVSLPYWDWSIDRTPTASLWSDDFMGGDGEPIEHNRVMTGPFAYATGNWVIKETVDDRPYLRRIFNGGLGRDFKPRFVLPTLEDIQATMKEAVYDVYPWNTLPRNGFRRLLESLHNTVHVWVGANMGAVTSPNDPVFFLHHCFIDKLWADWQQANPEQGYLPLVKTANEVGIDDPMRPWDDATPRKFLDYKRFYTYA